MGRVKRIWYLSPMRAAKVHPPVSPESPLLPHTNSESRGTFRQKPDPWHLGMAGHAQLKFVMTECSKTQIRLTRLKWSFNYHQIPILSVLLMWTHQNIDQPSHPRSLIRGLIVCSFSSQGPKASHTWWRLIRLQVGWSQSLLATCYFVGFALPS